MTNEDDIKHMAESLCERGFAVFTDRNDNRLVITTTAVFGLSGGEFMLSYENHGTAFFTSHRPMNQYRLANAGFSLRVSAVLADTVNRLFAAVAAKLGDKRHIEDGLVPIGEDHE